MSEGVTRGSFVHLHLHSEYSLLDGGNRVDKLVKRVKELGMHAVAVTDHGNMHAAVSFWETARRHGIKPILGVEAYVAAGDRRDRTYTGVADGGHHLVLLAENETGWKNLLYLCSEAYLTGFYFKPRMDREILEQHSEGLIAINGHLGSELAFHLVKYEETRDKAHWDAAVDVAKWHASVFKGTEKGPRFFVEIQHHIGLQNSINPHLIRLARELDLPLVCDNDSHFLLESDHDAHDTLICISTGKVKNDPDRMRYPTELFVKGPQEMESIFHADEYNNDAFGDAGREAMANTVAIADRCDVPLDIGANYAPVVIVKAPKKSALPRHDDPAFGGDLTAWFTDLCARFTLEPATDPGLKQEELKKDCDKALRLLAEAGMVWRYGPGITAHWHDEIEGTEQAKHRRDACATEEDRAGFDKWARLNRELKILADKLISAYFLIVWDFVNWGRQRGIPANARGSGVGTMVGFVLGLSNACPVHYGLLFERFTDPDRSEYPDIDIDLCQDGRGEVINYVREKYGHVAQIITFGTLKARAGIRDVARVLEFPLGEADKLAKLVPEELNITLDKALAQEPQLKDWYDRDETVRRIIDTARTFEGQARHSSVHAAGVIVATIPLHEVVPLYKAPQAADNEIVTQWDGPTCEKMGLLKMDFLGLRTLSVIERAKLLIRETLPKEEFYRAVGRTIGDGGDDPLDLERLRYDDQRVFELFRRGDTTGVFQFESGGMRRLLTEMKPDRLEDLIAANALFRPGPMDLIPDYNRRKHGQDTVPQVHPIVDKFTAETYGVMVYQEQVMQIVHELGGIPLRSAYGLIKAISKKKEKIIAAERPKFVEGAGKQGLPKDKAEELFELILKFAGYGFNKSHSTGYAIVAYQTAYLKTFFPAHYMAAFLTYESQAQKVSDWIPYLEDCRRTRSIDPATGNTVRAGVDVLPPDVNESKSDFFVVYGKGEPRRADAGRIRFGMRAIKGAGAKAIEAIVKERDGETEPRRDGVMPDAKPYTSLFDFCERVPSAVVNKATIEALVKAGAFDSLHGREARAAMVATIEQAVSAGQKIAADKAAGQGALFGGGMFAEAEPAADAGDATPLAKVEAWAEAETLRQEKETLGFYVSSHPLEEWGNWARAFTPLTVSSLKDLAQDKRVIVPAMVQSLRTIIVKNGRSAGQKMAILTVEDATGATDAVMFANVYLQFGHLFESDQPKFFMGRLDHSRGDAQIVVDRIVPIDGHPLEQGTIQVMLRSQRLNGSAPAKVAAAREILSQPPDPADLALAKSPRPVEIIIETEDAWILIEPRGIKHAQLRPDLVRSLCRELGDDSVRLAGGVSIELNKDDRRKQYARG
ncbi:MAG: DNA polymerase III subunit alpha [Phycisphaerales bacterium]|nr:DNA polymerase III subunit alpha [Planctomycetota bacterium]MCH8507987.1 DNA polymerase III subunit alpha [Phycisphaerales bacterium]